MTSATLCSRDGRREESLHLRRYYYCCYDYHDDLCYNYDYDDEECCYDYDCDYCCYDCDDDYRYCNVLEDVVRQLLLS